MEKRQKGEAPLAGASNDRNQKVVQNDRKKGKEEIQHQSEPANRSDVLLIGNSHTSRNFRLPHLNKEVQLEKKEAMTIGQARKELEGEAGRGTIVLHEITNDIGRNESEAIKCSNEYFDIIHLASTKAQKVIVSLGLPREDDRAKHQMTQMINWRLKSRFEEESNIIICEHDNMLYYGKPNHNYLASDGYHLSTQGKYIFSKNLTHCIHHATGLYSMRSGIDKRTRSPQRQNMYPNSKKQGDYYEDYEDYSYYNN